MTDNVNDSKGTYSVPSKDEISTFIENAIVDRISQINQANNRRLELFKAETDKYENVVEEHLSNRPSKDLLGDDETIRAWNDKRIELQGRLDVNKYQVKSMQKEIETNQEAVTRQARHQISKEHPEKYRLYQDAKIKLRVEVLSTKFEDASDKLENLINENASGKELYSAAVSVDRAITMLEKAKGSEEHASEAVKDRLKQQKSVTQEIQSRSNSRGNELE